jgi:CBS domain-containing protein
MDAPEHHDAYPESPEAADFSRLESAFLSDTVRILAPSEPIRCTAEATVHEAIVQMADKGRVAVVVVDGEGRLAGIFTERDLLRRVAVPGRDPRTTRLGEVMTPDPETLGPTDLIAYAISRLHHARYRTIPLVDADRRPLGVMTVNDIVQWLAELFPEAILNLRPGGRLKRPLDIDAG